MKTVTRQSQWSTGNQVVEISDGGLDYTNPDALAAKYPGEFEEFEDPREAVKTAIAIAEAWQKDCPDKTILIDHGGTGGMTMPFDGMKLTKKNKRALVKWADELWEVTPKCARCGCVLGKEKWAMQDSDEYEFCSDNCADNAYHDLLKEQNQAIEKANPDGCPKCGADLPEYAVDGSECPDCDHVYYSFE